MKVLKLSIVVAMASFAAVANGQRVCLEGCHDGDRVSLNFNPRAAQTMFDSLFFRLDSLTAFVEAWVANESGGGSSSSSGTSGSTSNSANNCDGVEIAAITCGSGTVTYDGYDYATVAIGTQCWFAENLRTQHYANGDFIPGPSMFEPFSTAWSSTTEGAQVIYEADSLANYEYYGRLYNSYAVMDERGLCPCGWHVPTDEEFLILINELGGELVAGDAMKVTQSDVPSWNGTNASGFSARPAGARDAYNSAFYVLGVTTTFYTSTQDGSNTYVRVLSSDNSMAELQNSSYARNGYSVRCLKDE